MKKKAVFTKLKTSRLIKGVIAAAILLFVSISQDTLVQSNGGYSDAPSIDYKNPNWMSGISGTLRLSELSLPGTHDSLSFHGGPWVQTQSIPLKTQLESGVRVFDIRTRHIENIFTIHHGPVYQKTDFARVMVSMTEFLKNNPSEAILIRVKQEYKAKNTTRSFEDTFEWYEKKYQNYIWKPTSQNPTLNEVRGKIVILQDFATTSPFRFGLHYRRFDIQDNWSLDCFKTPSQNLSKKWTNIKNHIEKAKHEDRNKIYINYLSAVGGLPCITLITPSYVAKRTNEQTLAYIRNGNINFTGIIMADFPGADLINEIIKLNRYRAEMPK
ncbi:MAG: phosphatidylinositol-specific phospholipase C [Moorea sp. SIO2B7]|nr:phosphatidylinositol-specific phospholipase C [Moorena sp. SIO2B7]